MATLLVLEWSRPANEIGEYLAMLQAETEWSCQFCWSDGMVDGFGLVDAAGNPKPEYLAFQAASGGDPMTAIEDRAAQLGPETLGEPLTEEVELSAGLKMRPYYNALLVEIPGAGVYALSEATVASKFRPAAPA